MTGDDAKAFCHGCQVWLHRQDHDPACDQSEVDYYE